MDGCHIQECASREQHCYAGEGKLDCIQHLGKTKTITTTTATTTTKQNKTKKKEREREIMIEYKIQWNPQTETI